MQSRNSVPSNNISLPETTKNSEINSVFGGPLSIKNSNSISLAGDSMKNEIIQKKLKKRLLIKNLIVTKFRNKYCITAINDEKLNSYI
jgi:hypothetical protein